MRTAVSLTIQNNAKLPSLAPLGGIASLGASGGGSIDISGNNSLTSINDLGTIPTFSLYGLTIANNPLLPNLQGLDHLSSAYGISISANAALSTLRALADLASIGGGLTIANNPALPTCEATWLVNHVGSGLAGGTSISGNNDAGTCPP